MKVLIIDSHKGSLKEPDNLHWLNASKIKNFLKKQGDETKLLWSYPSVNDCVESGFEAIIFNHASHYSYVDYAWLEKSPNAKLFYISNEFNLGEPRALWMGVKAGRKYSVIANHKPEISKIVKKYTSDWQIVNLNALIASETPIENSLLKRVLYYGSFRKGRIESFKKHLNEEITVSTHSKNRNKFQSAGINSSFIDRIKWSGDKNSLSDWMFSLYIEDEVTHTSYNFLANRFYEALNNNCIPIFSDDCLETIKLSGYEELPMLNNISDLDKGFYLQNEPKLKIWREKALQEKQSALESIHRIIHV